MMVADLDAQRLEAVQEELGRAVAVCAGDVRSESDVQAMVEATIARFEALHVVFANAGIGAAPIVDTEVTEWMRVIEVNLVGPLLTIKHAAPRMGQGGRLC